MYILIGILFSFNSLLNIDKDLTIEIDTISYSYEAKNYDLIYLSVINRSHYNYVIWLDDSLKLNHNEDNLIYQHFIKRKGDFSLFDLIHETLRNTIPLVLELDFLKLIKPTEKFTFIFINKSSPELLDNFIKKLVIMKEKKLDYYFRDKTYLNNFYYKKRCIVL